MVSAINPLKRTARPRPDRSRHHSITHRRATHTNLPRCGRRLIQGRRSRNSETIEVKRLGIERSETERIKTGRLGTSRSSRHSRKPRAPRRSGRERSPRRAAIVTASSGGSVRGNIRGKLRQGAGALPEIPCTMPMRPPAPRPPTDSLGDTDAICPAPDGAVNCHSTNGPVQKCSRHGFRHCARSVVNNHVVNSFKETPSAADRSMPGCLDAWIRPSNTALTA